MFCYDTVGVAELMPSNNVLEQMVKGKLLSGIAFMTHKLPSSKCIDSIVPSET
jgi:hypothetical protein